jgi:hypothetical protein
VSCILEKHPLEARTYDFDFSKQVEIAAGDTIASVTEIQQLQTAGGGTLTLGIPVASPTRAQCDVSGGSDGDDYTLTAVVLTVAGKTLVGCGKLIIRSCTC